MTHANIILKENVSLVWFGQLVWQSPDLDLLCSDSFCQKLEKLSWRSAQSLIGKGDLPACTKHGEDHCDIAGLFIQFQTEWLSSWWSNCGPSRVTNHPSFPEIDGSPEMQDFQCQVGRVLGKLKWLVTLNTGKCWGMTLFSPWYENPFLSSVHRKGSHESRLCSLICPVLIDLPLETEIGCRCSGSETAFDILPPESPSYSFSSYPGFSIDLDPWKAFP